VTMAMFNANINVPINVKAFQARFQMNSICVTNFRFFCIYGGGI